jgi:hypothetical protein
LLGILKAIDFCEPSSGFIYKNHFGNAAISPANTADAFSDFLPGVLVNVVVLVEFSEALHNLESLALAFQYIKNASVVRVDLIS